MKQRNGVGRERSPIYTLMGYPYIEIPYTGVHRYRITPAQRNLYIDISLDKSTPILASCREILLYGKKKKKPDESGRGNDAPGSLDPSGRV